MGVETLTVAYDVDLDLFTLASDRGKTPISPETASAIVQMQAADNLQRLMATVERLGFSLD
ncbi:MAG: hypothetical protein ACMVY4_02610 [Minwuia sp.]|uniref:hypothetical protein n=1 Tax=Minwuia sp. TaxID=2493630 RepID=UPI003A86BD3D